MADIKGNWRDNRVITILLLAIIVIAIFTNIYIRTMHVQVDEINKAFCQAEEDARHRIWASIPPGALRQIEVGRVNRLMDRLDCFDYGFDVNQVNPETEVQG